MKKTLCLLLLICLGCIKKPGQISLTVSVIDKNTISIGNVDNNLLANLAKDTIAYEQWKNLLPVYRMPADTDMKDYQQPQPGRYTLKNNAVIFSADTPFQKKGVYFVRLYHLQDDSNVWALLKGQWKQGSPAYKECIFKP